MTALADQKKFHWGFDVLFILLSDRPVVQSPADHPKNLTLAEEETATFNCKTIGNPPTTALKWQFNGNDLPGEGCSNCPNTTLKIWSVRRKNEGLYGCVGTNSLGDGPPAKAQLLIKRESPGLPFLISKAFKQILQNDLHTNFPWEVFVIGGKLWN